MRRFGSREKGSSAIVKRSCDKQVGKVPSSCSDYLNDSDLNDSDLNDSDLSDSDLN
jgi:hypothetical protein